MDSGLWQGGDFLFSGLFQLDTAWLGAGGLVGLVGLGTFSWAIPTAPGQREGGGMPAASRTTGPHELVCRHSTAFTREKKLPVRFPACQLVLGKSKGLFLGNIDIKAEKN